jgi:hypothetical protein
MLSSDACSLRKSASVGPFNFLCCRAGATGRVVGRPANVDQLRACSRRRVPAFCRRAPTPAPPARNPGGRPLRRILAGARDKPRPTRLDERRRPIGRPSRSVPTPLSREAVARAKAALARAAQVSGLPTLASAGVGIEPSPPAWLAGASPSRPPARVLRRIGTPRVAFDFRAPSRIHSTTASHRPSRHGRSGGAEESRDALERTPSQAGTPVIADGQDNVRRQEPGEGPARRLIRRRVLTPTSSPRRRAADGRREDPGYAWTPAIGDPRACPARSLARRTAGGIRRTGSAGR